MEVAARTHDGRMMEADSEGHKFKASSGHPWPGQRLSETTDSCSTHSACMGVPCVHLCIQLCNPIILKTL